jgi:GNAT superfamily N-acetyltransferase
MIRRARREEADELSQLSFRSKGFWGYSDDFMEACRDDLTVSTKYIESSPVYVAEINGKIVGFYGLVCSKSNAELRDLFVEPKMIGKGIGKQLWEHMIKTARELQIQKVFIHSDPHAEGFYKAMGAKRIGEVISSVFPNRTLPLLEFQIQDFEKDAEHKERKVVITTASIDDYENINDIVKEGQDEHAEALPTVFAKVDVVMPIDYYQQLLNDKNSEVLVAKLDGQVIGFAVLEIKEAPPFASLVPRMYAYISDFGVKKAFQNNGIGKQLFFACVEWAKEKDASSLELNVWEFNQKAITFYEKLGMKPLSRKMAIDL